VRIEAEKDELTSQLGEVQRKLIEMEAETGPARASALLYGLGFDDEDQKKPTRAFSGGWRMRLALARALFVKPDLLMLDEPSNMLGRLRPCLRRVCQTDDCLKFRFERHCMAGRLPAIVGGNHSRSVSQNQYLGGSSPHLRPLQITRPSVPRRRRDRYRAPAQPASRLLQG
jgi:hypothetical protein